MRAGLAQPARLAFACRRRGIERADHGQGWSVSADGDLRRNCYQDKGIDGLTDQERAGRRRHIDHRGVVAATLAPPPEMYGVTHWSTRWLARYLRIGDATVARAWRSTGFSPSERKRLRSPPTRSWSGWSRTRAVPRQGCWPTGLA